LRFVTIDNPFHCDIDAFVTVQETILRLRTIGLIATLALGLFAGPLPAEAQQAGKVYRVGWLRFRCGSLTTNTRYNAFRQSLHELGYVEGQNLVIEYRCAERKPERRPKLAAELVRLKVDVIVTPGSPGYIRAAQGATRTIPIVMSGIRVDPVKAGLVVSLARPGGNITGITSIESELNPKRLELLEEAFPRISRVAILWPRSHQKYGMKEFEAAGQALGIQIQSLVVTSGRLSTLESAFSAMSRERPDGLLVASTALTLDHRARIIDFAAKRRLPAVYARRQFMDAGGLMSYGPDREHMHRRIAAYVGKILKGAKPTDLPVEQPTKFDFVINLRTAKKLGLTFSPQFLARADKVIQ
jgi:putative ABC transport system substrate-binding protein